MTSLIVLRNTLSEEGDQFGLDSISSQDLPDEVDVSGCVDPFLYFLVSEIADQGRSLLHFLLGSFAFHGKLNVKDKI